MLGLGNFEQTGAPGAAGSLVLEISDMAAARAELHGHQVVTTEPFEMQVCWLSSSRDPDGNVVWLHRAKTRS